MHGPSRPSGWFIRSSQLPTQDPYTTHPRTRPRSRPRTASRSQAMTSATVFDSAPRKAFFRMPPLFSLVRLGIYAAVLLWTIICMAIAVHFHSMLQYTSLTRFVPLAIFVCVVCFLMVLVLVGFSSFRRVNIITTRIELGCLALLGILWITLGAFMATSDAADADVECYSGDSDSDTIDVAGFSTDTYHAQYRVLEAFSIFNALLIWGLLFFLLILSLRHHLMGNTNVWIAPVTAYPWFTNYAKSAKLPAPVTSRSNSGSSKEKLMRGEKRGRWSNKSTPVSTPNSTPRGHEASIMWMPQMPKQAARAGGRTNTMRAALSGAPVYDKYRRDASPQRTGSGARRFRDKYARDASPRR